MAGDSQGQRRRRTYLDFLRGVAVLLMIGAHVLDSWTRFPDRESRTFAVAMLLGGMGTTLFLVLAGIAVAMSAGSKFRRTQDAGAASRAVVRRGLEIFALAFAFRFQAWILGWSHRPADLLKVDILNIMGPSIVCAALLWRAGLSARRRFWLLAAAAAIVAFITPEVRTLLPAAVLPVALQAYLVPVAGLSNFVVFPWTALVFCGAAIGVLVDSTLTPADEARLNMTLAAGGAVLLIAAAGGSYVPPLSSGSEFWTTSPSYLFMRAGIAAIAVAACYAWTRMSGRGWSPVAQLGRTSLFIYWIHVEMVYGLISLPLHRRLSLPVAFAAYVVFCAFMLACSLLKEAAVARYRARQVQAVQAISAGPGPTR